MLKKRLLWVLVVLLPSYSYSDSITPYYGYTGNAAADSLTWSMGNILPNSSGLDINAVIYSYTIRKQTEDQVNVHIQNENANGTGYIFRETDEWMPGSLDGTQINRVVGVGSLHRDLWGDGSIEIDGNGSVEDPNVVYTYKVTPCYDPQFDPNCPGYVMPVPDIYEFDVSSIYDVTKDDNVTLNRETQIEQDDWTDEEEEKNNKEELEKQEEDDDKRREDRLEKALSAADNSRMFADALAVSQMIDTMNTAINMNSYYNATITGGVYKESTQLVDKQLPENRSGLRNGLAQQILHDKMVESQYK